MDWNWFYRTLAQSSAALVGVLGAYTFARLAAHRATASNTRTHLHDYLAVSTRYRAVAQGHPFEEVGEARLRFALRRLASSKRLDFDKPGMADGYGLYYGDVELFPCFQSVEASTDVVADMIRAFKEYVERGGMPRDFYHELPTPSDHLAKDKYSELEAFAAQIEQHVNSARGLMDALVDFYLERDALRLLILVCLGLFLTGVVWPLLYLPQPGGGSAPIALSMDGRLVLVATVSLVFIGFLVYLLWAEGRTSIDRMTVATVCKSTKLDWYHRALKAYEETRIRPDQYRSYVLESTELRVARALLLATAPDRSPLLRSLHRLKRIFSPRRPREQVDE